MHSRAFRILLLALIAVWYGAVLPGHQRGVVQLPGGGGGGDACCEHDGSAPEPAQSPRTCAVCFYMAALDVAAPPDLGIAPLGATDAQPDAVVSTPLDVRLIATYHGRAPPLA
jgi:hypothetical protein